MMNEHDFFSGKNIRRIAPHILEQLKGYGACIVSDTLKGFNVMDSRIQALVPEKPICGCAVTVRVRPGDKLFLHKAIEEAQEGDVLVVDTGCDYRTAVVGGIMSSAAFGKRKIAGLVIDGVVRDVEELRAQKYPVFAAGVVPNTGEDDGPGMLNLPISCGNIPVMPGDVIVGDDNGVVVIPADYCEVVLKICADKVAKEHQRMDEIEHGQITS